MNENIDDSGQERGKHLRFRPIDNEEMSVRLVEAALAVLTAENPPRSWIPLNYEMIAEMLSGDAAKLRMRLAAADVESAVRALDLAGTVVIAERGGTTCYRLNNNPRGSGTDLTARQRRAKRGGEAADGVRRKRKINSPWNGWKLWSWEQIEAAVQRTIATAKNGAALQDAVNDHIAKVNAIFIRLNAAYDRKRREIKDGEFDPQRRQRRLNRLFQKFYGVKRAITRKADRILIRMLRQASAE